MKRKKYSMTDEIKLRLDKNSLMKDYLNRPPYQQNDYIGWIQRSKKPETKEKRLQQMLYELKKGGIYMKMKHQKKENNSD